MCSAWLVKLPFWALRMWQATRWATWPRMILRVCPVAYFQGRSRLHKWGSVSLRGGLHAGTV